MYVCKPFIIQVKNLCDLLQINSIVFDKTGTVTHGIPRVTHIELVDKSSCTMNQLLALAGTAESFSEHPIASAIVHHAKQVRLPEQLISMPDRWQRKMRYYLILIVNYIIVIVISIVKHHFKKNLTSGKYCFCFLLQNSNSLHTDL